MSERRPAPALLRSLPKVDQLLSSPSFQELTRTYPRSKVVDHLRAWLDELRAKGREGDLEEQDLEAATIYAEVAQHLARWARSYYGRVVNATGVILHTGLGRAPLAPEVARELGELAARAQRVEIDLESGERGGREKGCDLLIRELTGCEAATVVNNNAAATLLILAALARGRRVLLSRGELVEIGGSFRIPEIMAESGAVLAEVGTTNRTHERDYRRALDEETGMILKV
ncbi:MAG: L-seryl-tRNA(Sec) selenium transferase, partial [Acidobacteria bacterium]|nr:L-seryl-tRNA(Sec) selenium transferase [Acidobacteriota bacterium]